MTWEVEYTDDFEQWWLRLDTSERESVLATVGLLEARGPNLPFPHSSDVKGGTSGKLRELRIQHKGRPLRVFYSFDSRRTAILLVGGGKTGDDRFYERMIPLAESLLKEHLDELLKEGDQ